MGPDLVDVTVPLPDRSDLTRRETKVAQETRTAIVLPEGVHLGSFAPVAYYDKHMDCIRVITHDRSVTEHRLNEVFTLHECNHRSEFDPEFVGLTIKGVRHLFAEVGLDLDGVYRLAELFDRMIKHKPGSVMSESGEANGIALDSK